MTDEREETSRKRNMKTDVFIAYGNTRTTNLVQIRKTSKFAAVFFQFISGRRSDEAVLRPRPAMQASRTGTKRPGNPGPEGMDCVYLRTLTMILRTVPSPTIGACPSSGKSTVNCPGRIV